MEITTTILKNFLVFALLVISAMMLHSCGSTFSKSPLSDMEDTPPAFQIENPPRRQGFDVVLVLMPATLDTKTVLDSFKDELIDDYDVIAHEIKDTTSTLDIAATIDRVQPVCILLMDNNTVKLYRQYQQSAVKDKFPPAVVVLTSYLDKIIGKLQNATGIAYEVPEVTIFVNLRTYLDKPINKVGVIYRKIFQSYLDLQTKFSLQEDIKTIAVQVSAKPTAEEVNAALSSLINEAGVDAIWVLNDNALLAGGEFISKGWLEPLSKKPIPVVVGVRSLVSKEFNFGSFGMVPDHTELGVQAANIIYDLSNDDWIVRDQEVEQPFSVKTMVDYQRAKRYFGLKENMVEKIDFVLK